MQDDERKEVLPSRASHLQETRLFHIPYTQLTPLLFAFITLPTPDAYPSNSISNQSSPARRRRPFKPPTLPPSRTCTTLTPTLSCRRLSKPPHRSVLGSHLDLRIFLPCHHCMLSSPPFPAMPTPSLTVMRIRERWHRQQRLCLLHELRRSSRRLVVQRVTQGTLLDSLAQRLSPPHASCGGNRNAAHAERAALKLLSERSACHGSPFDSHLFCALARRQMQLSCRLRAAQHALKRIPSSSRTPNSIPSSPTEQLPYAPDPPNQL